MTPIRHFKAAFDSYDAVCHGVPSKRETL